MVTDHVEGRHSLRRPISGIGQTRELRCRSAIAHSQSRADLLRVQKSTVSRPPSAGARPVTRFTPARLARRATRA